MINIYAPKETDFTHNGYGVVSATEAEITEELNGPYELMMTIPAAELNRRVIPYIENTCIIRAPGPWGDQLFRAYLVRKNLNGEIEVAARHIFYDGLYNMTSSASGTVPASDAFKALYSKAEYTHRFKASSNLSGSVSLEPKDGNIVSCILGRGGLVETLGKGELFRDNFNIALKESIGTNRGFTIRYRKNLIGLDIEDSIENLVTRIKPVGRDASGNRLYLPEVFVDSQRIGDYFMPLYGVLECGDIRLGSSQYPNTSSAFAQMRQRATQAFEKGADKPSINAKINFTLLRNTQEYKDFAPLEEIFLGDTVSVVHSELGIEMSTKCIKYVYNSALNRYKSIELGTFRGDFAANTNDGLSQLTTALAGGTGTINIAGVDTLGAGADAYVINEGTASQAFLRFGLPAGLSAYESAVLGGYSKSEYEFYTALARI